MLEKISAEHALAFIERCPFPILIRALNGCVTAFNPAFEQLVGTVAARSLINLDPQALAEHPAQVLLGEQTLLCWQTNGSDNRYLEVRDIVMDDAGQSRARLFLDVSRQVLLENTNSSLSEELQRNVMTDPLTGLLNRRGVVLALEPQIARSRRYNSPIAIIALRLDPGRDNEKLIIDVARLLKDQLRWADLIGRSEPNGFTLILPETTAKAALRLVDKVKNQIDDIIRRSAHGQDVVSSYGITDWKRNDNAASLINRAETALTRARDDDNARLVAL